MTYRLPFISVLALALATSVAPLPASAASVSVDIPESYTSVKAGERIYFQIEFLYPENPRRRDFRISYTVSQDANVLASASFLKAVETQASFTDYAVLPDTAQPGQYVVTITIMDDTGATVASGVSASFDVTSDFDWARLHFYVLLAAIIIMGLFIMVEIRWSTNRLLRSRS